MTHRFIFRCTLLLIFSLSAGSSALAQEATLPEAASVPGVVGHAQSYNLSCESRSAADWATFWGVHISESEFLFSLPSSDNPDVGFVGDPNGPWGYTPPHAYGVHAGPVAALLSEYGLPAEARYDLSWDELRAEIAAGRPVIVWVIGQMWPGTARSYTADDGETASVASFEHTMILVGYDAAYVQAVDASNGWTLSFSVNSFLYSWAVLGNMAVVGQSNPTHLVPAEGDYVVQQGDYLAELGRRFGVAWDEIARLNNIAYPYVIYPGQALKLPGAAVPTPQPSAAAYRVYFPIAYQACCSQVADQDEAIPTYTVQRGDYLAALAQQFGLGWNELAEINDIAYPYVIYPGQVLRLR